LTPGVSLLKLGFKETLPSLLTFGFFFQKKGIKKEKNKIIRESLTILSLFGLG